jgi:hypothetical protein
MFASVPAIPETLLSEVLAEKAVHRRVEAAGSEEASRDLPGRNRGL